MAEDPTLPHSGDLGVTLPYNSCTPAPPLNTTRTTVLPRVSLVGRQATFVVDQRVRYELGDPLGEGGGGEVLRAYDHDIGRHVALKRLKGKKPAR